MANVYNLNLRILYQNSNIHFELLRPLINVALHFNYPVFKWNGFIVRTKNVGEEIMLYCGYGQIVAYNPLIVNC